METSHPLVKLLRESKHVCPAMTSPSFAKDWNLQSHLKTKHPSSDEIDPADSERLPAENPNSDGAFRSNVKKTFDHRIIFIAVTHATPNSVNFTVLSLSGQLQIPEFMLHQASKLLLKCSLNGVQINQRYAVLRQISTIYQVVQLTHSVSSTPAPFMPCLHMSRHVTKCCVAPNTRAGTVNLQQSFCSLWLAS